MPTSTQSISVPEGQHKFGQSFPAVTVCTTQLKHVWQLQRNIKSLPNTAQKAYNVALT